MNQAEYLFKAKNVLEVLERILNNKFVSNEERIKAINDAYDLLQHDLRNQQQHGV